MNKMQKTSALGAMVLASMAAVSVPAHAQLFQAAELVAGYELAATEAACGGDKAKTDGAADKAKEGKCGEGKCGGDKAAAGTDKAKEGKCGGDKSKEASCGGSI